MSRSARLCSMVFFVSIFALGCATYSVPRAAQQGTTITVPLGNEWSATAFGGSTVTDPQRGEMRYFLETGYLLNSRASMLAAPHPATNLARSPSSFGTYQMVSIVDIPLGTPVGTHTLYAQKYDAVNCANPPSCYIGSPTNVGQIEILANTTDKTNAWPTNPSDVQNAVPDPQLWIYLPVQAYAARIKINSGLNAANFPLVDAYESQPWTSLNHRAMSRLYVDQNDGKRTADFVTSNGQPFQYVSLVFEPVGTNRYTNLANLNLSVWTYDANGVETFHGNVTTRGIQ